MGQRRLLRGILIGLGLLAAMTVWVVTWLLTQSPVALLLAHPDLPPIVGLAPRSTEAMLVLAAPLEDLQAFLQAATPAAKRRATRQRWREFFSPQGPAWLGSILAGGSLDFDREVRPWLGESTLLASLPQLGTLVALETEDPAASQFELNLLWERQSLAGIPVRVQTYKGIQVVSSPLPQLGGFSAAIFGERYVLLAEQAAAIREAIDAWQLPQLALVTQPQFQQVIEPLQEAHVGWAFWRNSGALQGTEGYTLTLEAVGLGLGLNFQGLVAQSAALWHAPAGFSLLSTEAFRPQIFKHLPDETSALISGQNLAEVWSSLGQIQPISVGPIGLQVDPGQWLNTLASQVDLDWQPLLPKTGEFALARLGSLIGSGEPDPSWLLVSEVPEPLGAPLEDAVQVQGWRVVSIPMAQGTATAWAKPVEQDVAEPDSPAAPQSTQSIHRSEAPILAASATEVSAFSASQPYFAEAIPDKGIPEPPPLMPQVYHVDRNGYCYLASSLSVLEAALQDPPLSAEWSWRKLVSPLPHRTLGYGYASLGSLLGFEELPLWKTPEGSELAATRVVFATTALTASAAPYPDQGRWITQVGKLFWQWY
ncbi:DUF3352 domain-containing protein [Synechococcus sp. Nb3U1]|uniref:DUF3352 domain-containing protein n=1 Tax=Synechococcus sp. Nb3U1 TaxID=1914529 RepID=UPI001F3351C6|nr:DUF3352 domain-containing protein [Synechococcus sp. Nb3U1]MCF2969795.1 DUF3352 domain-containing protein [Synechococcus sp. Nb3U1]